MTGADICVGWINSAGQVFLQVDPKDFIEYRTNISFSRIDFHLAMEEQALIVQPLTGLLYKVLNKMVGQLFSLNARLIHVIQWMFQSK